MFNTAYLLAGIEVRQVMEEGVRAGQRSRLLSQPRTRRRTFRRRNTRPAGRDRQGRVR